jgi:prepilin-type N-terminal cleavage/methylation domain-containing protein
MNFSTIKKSKRGLTLIELLLTTALISVLAAASFSMIYWQMRTQSHISQSANNMARLNNSRILIKKVLQSYSPASLSVSLDKKSIYFQESPLPVPAVTLFAADQNSLKFKDEIIQENVIASFSNLTASGSAITGMNLFDDNSSIIKTELTAKTGNESFHLSFISRPRGI